jgi:hypothetical protein
MATTTQRGVCAVQPVPSSFAPSVGPQVRPDPEQLSRVAGKLQEHLYPAGRPFGRRTEGVELGYR